jgi:uncharacterized protein YwqG
LELYEKKAADLSSVLDRKSDWEPYQKMVQKLLPEYNSWNWSTLGAYPQWIQSGETPKNSKQENMKLLFQLDSEDNADIMWGDAGCIYLFYDINTQETAFILQCN